MNDDNKEDRYVMKPEHAIEVAQFVAATREANRLTDLYLAVEFGYRACERGDNLQEAQSNFRELLD